jgi:hypothetical protein
MSTIHDGPPNEIASAFVERHKKDVIGVLQGWDRLRLQATLRSLYYEPVMQEYTWQARVLWKDFKGFATALTGRVREAAEALAKQHKRPVLYLNSSRIRKEDKAREIQQRDQIGSGLIAVLSCVEPCRTWFVRGNQSTHKLELRLGWGKCVHLYFYWMHEQLGFMHLRLQTWFPFLVQICLNGREWLGRQMDRAKLKYRRAENCFPWIADVNQAQALMDQQHQTNRPQRLGPLLQQCHPLAAEITAPIGAEYYWSAAETEYATDVMFRDRAALERIYPRLVHHAILNFGCEDVLRFMGKRGTPGLHDALSSNRRHYQQGVRVKHWVNKNSLKVYDKDSILRVETTINEPKDFRSYRCAEKEPGGAKRWRVLRRGVADFHRRGEVSRAANERYLTGMAAVHVQTTLGEQAAQVCRPIRRDGRRYRALNPMADNDAELVAIVNRGEFALNGFRNRDLRAGLYAATKDKNKQRKEMAAVGRRLQLLRAHGLIAKVPKTHRYVTTEKGRNIITALLTARQASTEQLTALAA